MPRILQLKQASYLQSGHYNTMVDNYHYVNVDYILGFFREKCNTGFNGTETEYTKLYTIKYDLHVDETPEEIRKMLVLLGHYEV